MILHSDAAGLRGYPGWGAKATSLGRKANHNYTIRGKNVKTACFALTQEMKQQPTRSVPSDEARDQTGFRLTRTGGRIGT